MNHDKDILEKHLLEFDDIFADICRVLIPGLELMQANELESEMTRDLFQSEGMISEVERDVLKKWVKKNACILMVGVENQTQKDGTISLRIMNYNASVYQRLLSHKRPLVPVITFVLYFGLEKPWEKAKSIYELIEVPGALEKFIPDFRAKVIDLGALEDETIESFQSDMKEIAKFIKLSRQGKKEFTFKGKLDHFAMVARLLSTLSSMNVPKEKWEELEEGGQNDMEHVFNYFSEEKTKKILDQGISQGLERGRIETKQTDLEILQWLQAHDRLDLSIQALQCSDIEGFKKRVLEHSI